MPAASPQSSAHAHDAVLLIAYGGPNAMAEVRPFLANALRGQPVPPERIEAVVQHYKQIGGRSPLTDLTFRQARALEAELCAGSNRLPVYVGMRNWSPYLREALTRMAAEGVRRAIGVVMTVQQTEASWDRYLRAVAAARAEVGPAAPELDYADEWHAHTLFIEAVADRVRAALAEIRAERRAAATLVFTAHSVPAAMAAVSPYAAQVVEAAGLVAGRLGHRNWLVAYQSRSGNPRDPWLEPDVCEVLRQLGRTHVRDVVVAPIGFVCDHVEVLYDLDIAARSVAEQAGLGFIRAATVGDHPAFIRMLADVVRQRMQHPT